MAVLFMLSVPVAMHAQDSTSTVKKVGKTVKKGAKKVRGITQNRQRRMVAPPDPCLPAQEPFVFPFAKDQFDIARRAAEDLRQSLDADGLFTACFPFGKTK